MSTNQPNPDLPPYPSQPGDNQPAYQDQSAYASQPAPDLPPHTRAKTHIRIKPRTLTKCRTRPSSRMPRHIRDIRSISRHPCNQAALPILADGLSR